MDQPKIQGREFMPSDDGGMGISGRWINKRTGQLINVRNSIIDGDNMIIITDNGQISMNEFSRDYVQASDELYNEEGKVIGKEAINYNDYVQSSPIAPQKTNKISTTTTKKKEVSGNDAIIKKVFDKFTSYPKLSVSIEWDDFPHSQLCMLVDYLDISIDDISSYIIKKFVNTTSLSSEIKEIIRNKLKTNISGEISDDKTE